jgi:hypothetical protein
VFDREYVAVARVDVHLLYAGFSRDAQIECPDQASMLALEFGGDNRHILFATDLGDGSFLRTSPSPDEWNNARWPTPAMPQPIRIFLRAE